MRAVLVAVVAVVAGVAGVAAVHAQPAPSNRERVSQALQKIAQLEQQLEYEQALVLADRTIAEGISTRDQLADLHLIAGRLAAGLDHPEVAQQHFAKLLALRPDTTLVAGTSPKLQAPFDAAKATPHELAVALVEGKLTVEQDALHLVAGTRIRGRTIEAYDELGNQLVVETLPRVTASGSGSEADRSRAWIPWAAASAATLIAGSLSAWRYRVAQDEWNLESDGMHDYTRLHTLEDRGQHWAIAADIGFGVAAATAVTAVILFATGESSEQAGVAFTGTGASFTARF